jgi:phage terminase large subunit-like protein
MHPATQYALESVEKTRVVGTPERLACLRHLYDLARAGKLEKNISERVFKATGKPVPKKEADFPFSFDETKAQRIYDWFKHCKHVEGPLAGKPITLLPFQLFDLGVIFGWVITDTGMRRFEKAYIQEARKNGKTTIMAGIANYLMVGDREESPAVYCAAVDRNQARLMYRAAMAMAKKSLELKSRLKIRDYEISHKTRGGQMVPLSKDTKNKDGLNPSAALIDEYHAHPTSEIYDLLWTAWGQRAQALMAIITTAGMDVESPCYKEYTYCKQILARDIINEKYFVMIRELDPKDDEHDPTVWVKANPLRASTPAGIAKLLEQHTEAFGSLNPAKIRSFRVKNINQWIHGSEDTYMSEHLDKWNELAVTRAELKRITEGLLITSGVDLSKRVDLTADGFLYALPDETQVTFANGKTVALPKDSYAVSAHGFIPEMSVKRHEKTDKIPYRDWARDNWVTITDGEVVDYRKVQTHIQDAELDGNKLHELCYDPYNATHFSNEMQDLGYTTIEIRQGKLTLSEPTKLFRELVAEGRLVHDGSPLLKWCVGNARQEQDKNENIQLTKKNADDTRRIDLLAAIINAIVRIESLREATAGLPEDWGM